MNNSKKCSIFCDIDGTLIKYREFNQYDKKEAIPIESIINRINKAYDKNHMIILTTARPEYLRIFTMNELNNLQIKYHTLLMSINRGPRILINDYENTNNYRAFNFSVKRNEGIIENSHEDYLWNHIIK